ncbi:MAG TPA: hypothetical protein VMT46_16755 [Anaerolineaceae bacterium]|nr:hypothetical protein [Anaerolineaceae bacterium]
MTHSKTTHTVLCFLVLFSFLLCACTAATPTPAATPTFTLEPSPTPPQFIAHPPENLPSPTAPAPSPTALPAGSAVAPIALAASPTPAFETRLPPEKWREWPVVPGLTARALEVYRQGIALGNDPRHFSKVGDCQSVNASFLGMFDRPGRYVLTPDYAYLKDTIDYFSGSFDRASEAVRGGFNAAAVLSPLWANPQACQAGENPLQCEIRVYKPSFVFISLEVWWDGRTAEKYAALLRQIVDYALDHGVVPILATKADNVEGDHSLNLATARIAAEYDLPLWNFWRAVQTLPNHGMDSDRPDGFHISVDAWNVRSFTALETLDSLRRGLQSAGAIEVARAATVTPTPAPTASPETRPHITGLSFPPKEVGSGPGQLFFDILRRVDEAYTSLGVFRFDLAANQLTFVLGEGYRLQAVSPDSRWVLASKGDELFLDRIETGELTRVSAAFDGGSQRGAVWLPDGRVVLLAGDENGLTAVDLVSFWNGEWTTVSLPETKVSRLYPGYDGQTVYWDAAYCGLSGDCVTPSIWSFSLKGGKAQPFDKARGSIFVAGERFIASSLVKEGDRNGLLLYTSEGSSVTSLSFSGTLVADAAWSPDGKVLSVVSEVRSGYSGLSRGVHYFIVVPPNWQIKEYPPTRGINPRTFWSPDGKELLESATMPTDSGGYQISLRRLNLLNSSLTVLDDALNLTGSDYILVGNLFWTP